MTARASILAVTAIAALGSSFLVPGDAFASSRGFAHAARVSRSVHISTGSVHTASVGFHRSTGFQHGASSGTVAGGSFTQRRFGSANTAAGRPPSFANQFSNRTFGHTTTPTGTPQFNTLATNGAQLNTTHALADPCSGVGAPKTCFLNQGKGVGGTGGSAAALGGAKTTNIGSPVLTPVTEPAIPPSGSKGSGGNTNANNTTGNGKAPTGGGTGSGSGGNTNANNTPGNGNNTYGRRKSSASLPRPSVPRSVSGRDRNGTWSVRGRPRRGRRIDSAGHAGRIHRRRASPGHGAFRSAAPGTELPHQGLSADWRGHVPRRVQPGMGDQQLEHHQYGSDQ